MERTFERYRFKFSEDDKFNLFVSIITNAMDPHTEFSPPVDKRYFDEQMSGRFFGIGASLIYDEGNIKNKYIDRRKPGMEKRRGAGR